MPYIVRSHDEILAELQEHSQIDVSKTEGTFAWDVFSSNAIEFAKMENELAEVYRAVFGHTAFDEYLELKAEEHGIIRKPASKAIGQLEITGNGTIYSGALFQTDGGTRFIATSETKIVGVGLIDIEAVDAGAKGNVAAQTITRIPMSIAGIRSCTNPAKTYDGFDEEDDETLRERFLTVVRYPAASGNPQQYIQWATSITGVGAARCKRCYNGRGSVKVVIVDSNFQSASEDLIETVYNYVYENMPADVADLSVVSAQTIPIDISARVYGTIDLEAFKKAVLLYFTELVKATIITTGNDEDLETTGYVSVAQIGKLIITMGKANDYDHNSLLLNGGANNVYLSIDEIPTLGEINFYA